MKTTLPIEELHYDMSQFYPLKAVLEQLLGRRVYLRLKETGTLRDWKVELRKLLRAIKLSIKLTVEIADDQWFVDVYNTLELGQKQIGDSKTVTALFAHLSATLTRLVFLQIGYFPSGRYHKQTIPITKEWWTLKGVRTVQYVQSGEQRRVAGERQKRRASSPDPTPES